MLKMQEKLSNTFFAILALPATALGFALSVQISALSWSVAPRPSCISRVALRSRFQLETLRWSFLCPNSYFWRDRAEPPPPRFW